MLYGDITEFGVMEAHLSPQDEGDLPLCVYILLLLSCFGFSQYILLLSIIPLSFYAKHTTLSYYPKQSDFAMPYRMPDEGCFVFISYILVVLFHFKLSTLACILSLMLLCKNTSSCIQISPKQHHNVAHVTIVTA